MSPRTSTQFEKMREEKAALIMEVALEHFADKGFHSTTISHIAKHAGISKGLIYNYFSGKEDLLSAIIHKSVNEIYGYFDMNRDGYLSAEEFEFFVRKVTQVLKEKQEFWRLFFQLLMQSEVRRQFQQSFPEMKPLVNSASECSEGVFIPGIMKVMTDYFSRKKDSKEQGYDPLTELNIFILTMKGFAVTFVYSEKRDEENFDKMAEAIITQFK